MLVKQKIQFRCHLVRPLQVLNIKFKCFIGCFYLSKNVKKATLHKKETLYSSLFIIKLHPSSCQSDMSHSALPASLTTALAADRVVNTDWESFTPRFQSLIPFQACSLCDGDVLASSVVNTETVFSVYHSLLDTALIKLYQATSYLDFYMR